MFDLQSSIHFHEVEVLVIVGIHDKLDRSSSDVAHSLGSFPRFFGELLSELKSESGSRRFLDDLLMSTLYRAISLEEGDVMSLRIRENLNFHVCFEECCQLVASQGYATVVDRTNERRLTYDEE